jgi:hypothetical protein
MNTSIRRIACVAALAAVSATVTTGADAKPSVSTPVTKLQFGPTGVSDGVHGELLAGPAYGDLTHGPHGTFIRMPAGFVSHPHVHTGDYWGVVISGVAVNGVPGSPDVQLPPGSFWYQTGGEKHVTKCVSPQECLFFISQDARFDYVLETTRK